MNNYGVAGSNCSELVKANTSMKHDIERTTTYYLQACTLVESILPSIFCLFVGPWTDEHGRKWPIVSNNLTNHCLIVSYQQTLNTLGCRMSWYYSHCILLSCPHLFTSHRILVLHDRLDLQCDKWRLPHFWCLYFYLRRSQQVYG